MKKHANTIPYESNLYININFKKNIYTYLYIIVKKQYVYLTNNCLNNNLALSLNKTEYFVNSFIMCNRNYRIVNNRDFARSAIEIIRLTFPSGNFFKNASVLLVSPNIKSSATLT